MARIVLNSHYNDKFMGTSSWIRVTMHHKNADSINFLADELKEREKTTQEASK